MTVREPLAAGAFDGFIRASLPIAGLGLVFIGLALAGVFALLAKIFHGGGFLRGVEYVGLVIALIGVLTIHDNPPPASSHSAATPPAHTQTHQEAGPK